MAGKDCGSNCKPCALEGESGKEKKGEEEREEEEDNSVR